MLQIESYNKVINMLKESKLKARKSQPTKFKLEQD